MVVKTLLPTDETVFRAVRFLQQGGLVAFPTETVYGLGADAFNSIAVARIFDVKQRPLFDPLIIHIAHMDELKRLVEADSFLVRRLAEAFWPGPLTLVLPKKRSVPDIVTAGLPTVAVRIPCHGVARRLIELAECPVAAPSANPFGMLSPTTAAHVASLLGDRVDMILDGGPCTMGVESTILSLVDETRPVLLRQGAIPVEDLRRIVGDVYLPDLGRHQVEAPGMLPGHYAPRTPIRLLSEDSQPVAAEGMRIGLLAFTRPADADGFQILEVLSATGDLKEAAANLFAALHRLDEAGLDYIVAERVPQQGIGAAINDRLTRAACADPFRGCDLKNCEIVRKSPETFNQ
jgi:L-threonylcarbamoyladenylate synthase